MADRWFPKSIAQEHVEGGFNITLTTDTGCHLWLYWTDKEPWVHRRATVERGLTVPWHSYWCFVDWHLIEQNEAGDTTTHTFDWLGWEICQTKWFTFHGEVAGTESPSSAPILHKHYTAPPPPPPTPTIRLFSFRNYITEKPLGLKTQDVDDDGIIADLHIDHVQADDWGGSPKAIHVAGNVYLVLYSFQDGGPLQARTFSVTPEGDISDSPIDTLILDAVSGVSITLLHIAGNVFASVYMGPGSDGWLVTFDCNDNGTFGGIIGTLEFDPGQGRQPSFVHVSGTTYAIAYQGTDADGFLKTIIIEDDGTITRVRDTWEYDPGMSTNPKLLHVAGNVFALFYQKGSPPTAQLQTLSIADDGVISKWFIDFLGWSNACYDLNRRAGTNYFVLSTGNTIKTILIDDDGTIAPGFADTLGITCASIFNISSGVFLTFTATHAQTFPIDEDGQIGPIIDTELFTGWAIWLPDMITLATV